MKQRSDGTYASTSRPIAGVLVAAFFAFVLTAWTWSRYQSNGMDGWTILLALALAGVIALGINLPTMRFVFDPAKKLVTWSSRSLMSNNGGQFSFDAVREVVLQSTVDEKGYASYRVAICTDRDTVPISAGYGRTQMMAERQATEIRKILGMPVPSAPDDSIAATMGIRRAQ
jgi:hypothetical protein